MMTDHTVPLLNLFVMPKRVRAKFGAFQSVTIFPLSDFAIGV